jgi:hypothetical protein
MKSLRLSRCRSENWEEKLTGKYPIRGRKNAKSFCPKLKYLFNQNICKIQAMEDISLNINYINQTSRKQKPE